MKIFPGAGLFEVPTVIVGKLDGNVFVAELLLRDFAAALVFSVLIGVPFSNCDTSFEGKGCDSGVVLKCIVIAGRAAPSVVFIP